MNAFRLSFFVILAVLLTACNSTYQPEQTNGAIVDNSTVIIGITEQTAFEWLLVALERHQVADLDCLKFRSESNNNSDEAIAPVWEFAAVEVHDAICGGDPDIAHVRDRYQIGSDGSVMVYDVRNADYKPL